ncbi:hypothetical protein UFOVP17_47 [uncultured Caudovirales phage]|uniref:Group I intron endonuclease n=1 Tax=uncultured Caudovirales phage TaxID=2100421 RepID=A0A6J5KPH1_9CAUD|nr:hypothetical protein UFOVP17_47 [uncultured Caudovirales phage]
MDSVVSNMNNAYVYIHTRLNTNLPFYVGKGKGKRFNSTLSRNKHWNNVVKKDGGFNAVKLIENVCDEFAYFIESEVIDKYKLLGYKLVNKTNGGEGVSGSNVNAGIAKTEEHKQKLRDCNLGKKQSYETIEKRKKSLNKKINNGWETGFAIDKYKKYGIKNNKFVGVYHTPAGIFESLNDAAIANNCTIKTIRIRCNGNKCIVNGKLYIYPPKNGWYFVKKA